MSEAKPSPIDKRHDSDNDDPHVEGSDQEDPIPYPDTVKYRTWHKHVRDLYQSCLFIDMAWSTRSSQFMPYVNLNQELTEEYATQTILTGTNRDNGDQNYIQLWEATLPCSASGLHDSHLSVDQYEVGGYGKGNEKCGVSIGRSMYHDGAVVACRYMPANPLLIASSSDNSNCYIFNLATISATKPPNAETRPTCPYPPKELPPDATDEQKTSHAKRMEEINTEQKKIARWDAKKGEGQHTLTLVGNKGLGVAMDWRITSDGTLACGSDESVVYWEIANLSKTAARTVEPMHKVTIGTLINDVKFSWFDPNRSYIAANDGTLSRSDLREKSHMVVVGANPKAVPFTLAMSSLNDVVLAVGGEDGVLRIYDQRNFMEPVVSLELHAGAVGPLSWSPFVEGYIASGGQDGLCTLSDAKTNTLLFKHAAHVETITDIDWSWQEQFMGQLVSCDANAVTIWKPRNTFWTP